MKSFQLDRSLFSRASGSAFNAALTSRSSRTVISSTVFSAPVDGIVCGWDTKSLRSMSDGSVDISSSIPIAILPDVGNFVSPKRSVILTKRSACDVDMSICRNQAVHPPCDSANFVSLTCFKRRPISNIASPATRLYAFISAVIVGRSADSCVDTSLYCANQWRRVCVI